MSSSISSSISTPPTPTLLHIRQITNLQPGQQDKERMTKLEECFQDVTVTITIPGSDSDVLSSSKSKKKKKKKGLKSPPSTPSPPTTVHHRITGTLGFSLPTPFPLNSVITLSPSNPSPTIKPRDDACMETVPTPWKTRIVDDGGERKVKEEDGGEEGINNGEVLNSIIWSRSHTTLLAPTMSSVSYLPPNSLYIDTPSGVFGGRREWEAMEEGRERNRVRKGVEGEVVMKDVRKVRWEDVIGLGWGDGGEVEVNDVGDVVEDGGLGDDGGDGRVEVNTVLPTAPTAEKARKIAMLKRLISNVERKRGEVKDLEGKKREAKREIEEVGARVKMVIGNLEVLRGQIEELKSEVKNCTAPITSLQYLGTLRRGEMVRRLRGYIKIKGSKNLGYEICGIPVPNHIAEGEEECVSAALGLVVMVLRTVGDWEGLIYKYGMRERGGRGEIGNTGIVEGHGSGGNGGTDAEGQGGNNVYPLYGKRQDPGGFMKGVSLLCHNIRQLGRVRGVDVSQGHVVAMLGEALGVNKGWVGEDERERLKTLEAMYR